MSAAAGRRDAPRAAGPGDARRADAPRAADGAPRAARLLRALAVLPIRAYRLLVSPLKPTPTCRFHPTCSAYARDAILTHGVLRGGTLAMRRVLKCHPWHPGGLDPVPAPGRPHRHPPEEP